MDARCRVELFGGVRLLRDDRVVSHFRTRKAAHLLACLCLPPGRSHTRDILAERFWPDLEPGSGRRSLSNAMASLRPALEPEGLPAGAVLLADRLAVRANPAAVTTDVQECEELLRQAGRTPDPSRRALLLGRAVGLYGGPLVPDCYDDWILPEQRRWAERHVDALLAWAQALEEAGDLEGALEVAARAAAEDPMREEGCACRIRVYAALGRYSDARACYRAYERTLAEEAGAPPLPALRTMVEQLQTAPQAAVLTQTVTVRPAEPPVRPLSLSPLRSVVEPRFPPLPAALNSFVGRRAEMERLVGLLVPRGDGRWTIDDGPSAVSSVQCPVSSASGRLSTVHRPSSARLVTVTGPGGCGKTRLAMEVARRLEPAYRQRVAVVPLESLPDPARIAATLGRTLDLSCSPEADPLDCVAEALDDEPCLLVLDNFEHLLARPGPADARALLLRMLDRMPTLRLLVTSRQALTMSGEREVRLTPLSTPAATDMDCDSVALFVDRARQFSPAFGLTPENAGDVAALCDRLEGLPLAIEMAATWTRVLPARALRDRLASEPTALVARSKDVAERHQSLRAALDWSYELLDRDLRACFAALSVFRGGWTLEAAEAVVGEQALGVLADLEERSLVIVEEQGARYRYLETVREFAYEQLCEHGQEEARDRHARYYLRLAEQAAQWAAAHQHRPWREIGRDYPNVHAALCWLEEAGRAEALVDAVTMLELFWVNQGHHLYAGVEWADRALTLHPTRDLARCRLLRTAGLVAAGQERWDAARRFYAESLSIGRELADPAETVWAAIELAGASARAGDAGPARQLPEDCRALLPALHDDSQRARALLRLAGVMRIIQDGREEGLLKELASLTRSAGLQGELAHALYGLAMLAGQRGDAEAARALWEECLALDEAQGIRGGGALWGLAMLAEGRSDTAQARYYYSRSLCENLEVRNWAGVAEGLEWLAGTAMKRGQAEEAARVVGAALRQRSLRYPEPVGRRERALQEMAAQLRGPLGAERCEALLQEGWQMEPEAAIELALDSVAPQAGSDEHGA